ncbi:MAG: fibronectin type III domain-containing protein, partial [Methanomassiliicoccales archaeon]
GAALPSHSTGLSTIITDLSNGHSYAFTVAAHNLAGIGDLTGPVSSTPYTRPDAPTLISIVPGLESLTLTWEAPDFDGGSAITSYRLYWDTADPPIANHMNYGPGVYSIELTGLTAGFTYYMTASAKNAAGESVIPTALSGIPMTVPGAPVLNSAVEGTAQVVLIWTAPTDPGFGVINAYKIYWGTSPSSLPLYAVIPGDRLTYNVTDLTPGTQYYFGVKANNLAGDSSLSNLLTATPYTVPDAPALIAAEADNASVTLTWLPPAYDGSRPLTGYKIYFSNSTGPEVLFRTVDPGILTVRVTGVTPGAEYLFWVMATNVVGDSPISNILAATPYTTPGAPRLDSASAGRQQVTLTWSAPSHDGGSPLIGYKVFFGTDAPTQQFEGMLSSSVRTVNVTGLTAGLVYHFAVKAVNVAGDGVLSNELTATPYTIPGAPVLDMATAGNTLVTLSWTAPSDTGSTLLLGYKLYYGMSTPDTQFGNLFPISVNSASVTDLTPGVLYHFAVKAVNAAGDSLPSNSLPATPYTWSDPPALQSADGGVLHVTLNWTEPSYTGSSSITGYKIFFGTTSPNEQFGGVMAPSARSVNVTGLQTGVVYQFAVKAVNVAGDSALSNVKSAVAYTVPSAPVLTSATAGIGRVTVNWTAPTSNGGAPLIGYRVYYGTTIPDVPLDLVPADVLGMIITGLDNGSSYQFAVKAVNAAGESPLSNLLNAMPYTIAGAPALVSATGGLNSALLVWTAPANDGGASILGYKVFFGLSEPNTQFGTVLSAATLSINVTELGAGSRYYFAVRAVNAAGESAASNVLNATAMTGPGAPTGLTATPSDGKIILSWQAPAYSGGSAITSYTVYRAVGGVATLLANVGAAMLNYTDSTASVGATYTYYVMASNSVGIGSSSVPVSGSVPNPPADNTLLFVGLAITAIAAIALGAVLWKRKN